VKLIVFVGKSNTGKTSLIKLLICELKQRGYSVGALKSCSRGFSLDLEGKDSWYLMEAGADAVALVSERRTAVIRKDDGKPSMKDVAESYFKNMDIVLSEGGHGESGAEKIEVLREGIQMEPETPVDELLAVVADFEVKLDIPVFKTNEIKEIADLIENGTIKREVNITLKVDKKNIPLNCFLQQEFSNVLRAAVKPLHGVEDRIKEIELSIMEDSKICLKINGKRVGLNRFLRGFISRMVSGMTGTLEGVQEEPKKIMISVTY